MKEFILKLVESSIKHQSINDVNFVPNQEWLKKEFCAIQDILDVEGAFKYFDDIAEELNIQ